MTEETTAGGRSWSETDERKLEKLLRGAGRRSSAPAGFDEVEKAVMSAWVDKVHSTRRRRRARTTWMRVAVAASLLLATGLALLVWRGGTAGAPVILASLERDWGSVALVGSRSGGFVEGSEVSTREGGAAFRMRSGQSVRLDRSSRLVFESVDRVRLVAGAVYVDSGDSSSTKSGLEIATELGLVREVGTQYEVRLEPERLRVRVREGRVAVERRTAVHTAGAGEELLLTRGDSVERTTTPAHGASWDWVLRTAPWFRIEGQSMLAFLRWVERESGWKLRFVSDSLIETSSEITLHGSIEGLALVDALDTALAGSGLGYRLEGDELVIETAP